MKILVGTGNKTRRDYLQGILKDLDVELVCLTDIGLETRIEETGNNVSENSELKATGYMELSGYPTLSVDAGLYIDSFPDELQPGTFVKRIYGDDREATDKEMLAYYVEKLRTFGGSSFGRWDIAMTLAISKDEIYRTRFERHTSFTSKVSKAYSEHEPLNSIQIDEATGKYVAELSLEEKKRSQDDLVDHIHGFVSGIINKHT